jgi:hypothetical protein
MKKTIILLVSCFFSATTIVLALYALNNRIVHAPGSFLRTYQKYTATKVNDLNTGANSYYIAGITDDHIYLGNIVAPLSLLVTNHSLTDTQHVRLRIRSITHQKIYAKTTIKIDPPYFYIADGSMPGVYRGKLGEWEAQRFMFDSAYFTKLVPISKSSFAIRTNNPATLDNVLGKMQTMRPHVKLEPGLLVKQVDGIFCTDGDLLYNENLRKLIYTYHYRNGYVVYDTTLALKYRGHTIDTFSRSQVKVGYVKSNDSRTLTYRRYINLGSSTSGNHLFIHSNLMAKNDPENILQIMSVVDVYDLLRDRYAFSFFVHNYDEKIKMRDFMVFDNKMLIALYDSYVVRYDLKSKDLLVMPSQ